MTAAVLDRIQAHVFRSAGRGLDVANFFFLRVPDAPSGRRLLGSLLDADAPRVLSDAEARRHPVRSVVAFGVTRQGLERFGPERFAYRPLELRGAEADLLPGSINDFEDPFVEGMWGRRQLLEDRYPPDTPFFGAQGPRFDALCWLAARPDAEPEAAGRLRAWIDESGCELVHHERAATGPVGVQILGYRDGRSQPYLGEFGTSPERLAGGGTVTPDGWRPVRAGEFVLGLVDEGNEADVPGPAAVARHGTFLVYRKYAIDKQAFEELLAGEAGPDEELAAKLMGRYRAGAEPGGDEEDAVMRAGRHSPAGGRGGEWHNDFRYEDDTSGFVCPLGSHIRRANPRDALGFDGDLTRRHRIIRRGAANEDGTELHFVAVNARIRDQFEFIQRLWFNTGDSFHLGTDRDIFAGAPRPDGAGEQFIVQGREPQIVHVPSPVAVLQGGEYFLMPGMQGLEMLRDSGP